MNEEWKKESIVFDRLYTDDAFVCAIPFLGGWVKKALMERLERASAFLSSIKAKTIIDLGCGAGIFALNAARQGVTVYGFDISSEAIRIAKERAREAGLEDKCTFYETDIREVDYPEADAWFDLGTLQYIQDINGVLSKLRGIKNFFSGLPGKDHWLSGVRYVYRKILKGSVYYSYTQDELKQLFSVYGDVKIERSGMVYYITHK